MGLYSEALADFTAAVVLEPMDETLVLARNELIARVQRQSSPASPPK